MKKIEDKIKNIEEKIREDFKWGSTRIDPECLSEAEKKLFNHCYQAALHKPGTLVDSELINRNLFYILRRAFDLFMGAMNVQLNNSYEQFIFWSKFIDFVSETMYKINYHRGVDFVSDMMFGEDPEEWPEDDDPAWKKFENWEKKWSKEFKQLWKEISPTAEKLFFQKSAFPKKDDRANKEEAKIKMSDLFGKIISYCLTRPSHLDIAGLATVSLEESEPLDKILRKTKRSILAQKQ